MIEMQELVTPDRTLLDVRAGSKRQVLQALADAAGHETGLDPTLLLDVLQQRERLGTTGLGEGVAIPHARVPGLESLTGFFLRLAKPIDFDALDAQPVDLVFALLAPEAGGVDHLKALSRIARVLRDDDLCTALREATTPEQAHALLCGLQAAGREGGTP